MVDKLRLEVLLAAVDKVTGPLKNIQTGSRKTAQSIGEAELALKKFEAQQRKLQRLQDAKTAMGSERNTLRVAQSNLAALNASGNATAKQIAAQEKAVQKQTTAYERQRNVVLKLRSEVTAMGLGNASQAQLKLAASIATTNAQIDAQRRKLEIQQKTEERLANLREKHSKTMMRLGMAGATAAAGMHVGRRMVQTGLAPVDSFMQHEDGMMGVQRQVQGARDDKGNLTGVYRKAEEEIRALSERIPQTTVQIAEMYTAAARMEVPTDKLAMFVELTSDLATAFDAVPDEMAESMGKIANNLKIPITEIRGLADTINYLDDNAISKGADIIGFLNRVGGVAGTVGITGQNMAALGSTLLTSGETEETAGTAVKAIFTNFAAATKGTKRFKSAVGEIGMTPQQLQAGMAKDAVGTLGQVAEAIKKLPKKDQLGVMAELAGKEHVGRLAKLVTNTEELRRQIELANGAEAAGSMAREAGARNSALSAQLQMQKNRVFNAMATAGETLKAPLLELLEVVNPLLKRFTAWMQENPQLVGGVLKTMVVLGALITALSALGLGIIATLGPMMLARFLLSRWLLGLVASRAAAAGAAPALGLLGRTFSVLRKGIMLAGRAILFIGRALLMNPIGMLVTAIAVAAFLIYKYWDPIKAFFSGLWEDINTRAKAAWEELSNWLGGLWDSIVEKARSIWGRVKATISNLLDGGVAEWSARLLSFSPLGILWSAITTALDALGISVPEQFRSFGGAVIDGLMGGITSRAAALRDTVINMASSMASLFKEKLGIHSPSRVFMRLGSYVGEGAALGIQQGAGMVRTAAVGMAAATMVPMAAMGAPANAGPAMGGGSTYQITINAAPGMDAQAIARAVSAELDRRESANASRRYSRLADID